MVIKKRVSKLIRSCSVALAGCCSNSNWFSTQEVTASIYSPQTMVISLYIVSLSQYEKINIQIFKIGHDCFLTIYSQLTIPNHCYCVLRNLEVKAFFTQ
jgi:hypothetical protein